MLAVNVEIIRSVIIETHPWSSSDTLQFCTAARDEVTRNCVLRMRTSGAHHETMASHKVSEMEGALLDKAVAIALGWRECVDPARPQDGPQCWQFGADPKFHIIKKKQRRPHADWGQAGSIIERKRIALAVSSPTLWLATCSREGVSFSTAVGARPLIAAMRAFVVSRLGEEVEVP